jgi:hypothetical protein
MRDAGRAGRQMARLWFRRNVNFLLLFQAGFLSNPIDRELRYAKRPALPTSCVATERNLIHRRKQKRKALQTEEKEECQPTLTPLPSRTFARCPDPVAIPANMQNFQL